MLLDKMNKVSFWIGVFGIAKIICNLFGLDFISDQQVNEYVNILASVGATVGVVASHQNKLTFAQIWNGIKNFFVKHPELISELDQIIELPAEPEQEQNVETVQ